MAEADPYQYIVVKDTNQRGVLACQAAHAAGESMVLAHPNGYDPSRIHVVLLVAKSSQELEDLGTTLQCESIPHIVIREPDAPYNGVATAVGISPTTDRERVRPFVNSFKVLR